MASSTPLTNQLPRIAPTSLDRPPAWRARLARRLSSRGLVYAMLPALSLANAGVGLLLPLLLGPAGFGQYAIVVTLFQYALIFDLGISQLIDRRIPVLSAAGAEAEWRSFANDMLWLRLYIAVLAMAGGGTAILLLARSGLLPFPPAPALLALAAGLCFMLALGPAAIHRALAQGRPFALINAALMVVLATARPLGMVLGGVTGSFLAIALCYGAIAAWVLRGPFRPNLRAGWPRPPLRLLLLQGMPLFLTSFVWACYMTANRWVVSLLAEPVELGKFAFGANVVYLVVGAIGALSQFYYPKVVARFSAEGPFAVSADVARDLCRLALATAVPTALGILAAPWGIALVYAKFAGSEGVVQLLAVAIPSLVLASWAMPLSLSTAARPWIEGLLIYPGCLAALIGLTWGAWQLAGAPGAACGLVLSALPLLALQLAMLRATRLLRTAHAAAILALVLAVTGLLWLLAWLV